MLQFNGQEWMTAACDPFGKEQLQRLIEFEDKWVAEDNPRKYIKVHRAWDVRLFLKGQGEQLDLLDVDGCECGYCSI